MLYRPLVDFSKCLFNSLQATEQVLLIDSKKGKQLTQEIDIFIKHRQKQNKILAKNVAQWVDQAMTINSNLKEKGEGADMCLEDLDMGDFDDDEDMGVPGRITSTSPNSRHKGKKYL